ncbi:Hpt domain-containing protein [Geminicoccaceae bacterium 1502E]|nr:Hpt domain-containing protein [Geminicoccaceae bacterium 1502E]
MTSSPPPLDREHLASFTQGDERLEQELAALFVGAAERYLGEMRCSSDNERRWRRAAHALKGASANLGASAMADLAARAEQEPPSPERLRALEAELEALRAHFGLHLPDAPPRAPISRR